MNTDVEGCEANASLDILDIHPVGRMQASNAEAGGGLADTGSETEAQSDAMDTTSIDDGSGPTAGVPWVNAIAVATAGGALTLHCGTVGNCEGRSNLCSTMWQCGHLMPSKSESKPTALYH